MVAKKRLLGVAVVLGVALAAVSQLRWMAKRERAAASEAAPTNAVVATSATSVTNAVAKAKVKVKGEQRKDTNSIVRLPTPNLQPPTPNLPPPKARKPIAYDPKIPKARQVLLANRRIAVASGRSFPKKFCAAQTPTARGTAPYVLVSEPPVSRDVRIQVVADGAKVVGFLPNNALLVEADAQALRYLEEDPMFTAAVEYEPTDKIQRALLAEEGETVEATVVLLNPQDKESVCAFIADNGGAALDGMPPSDKTVNAKMPRALVEKLAGKAEVKWIERFSRLKALNDKTVLPACMNVTPVWNLHGLDGTGEVVTIDDTGIDTGSTTDIHRDFQNKIVKIVDISGTSSYWHNTKYDANGHGTHVAGSLAGSGVVSNGLYAGVAKGAKLYFQAGGAGESDGYVYFDGLKDFADLFAPNRLRSSNYITSISLGGSASGAYTYFCSIADEAMWTYPELLVVLANGNSGPRASTVYEPAAAKNCLSVGNSYSTRNGGDPTRIASNSSRGPCQDGRIKPEVTAPGVSIISTRSSKASGSGDYTTMSGTSMATPHVAGAAAIVRQWLRRDRGFDNNRKKPSGALLKAILTGGANGGTTPDNTFGWGRVDLEASIFPKDGQGVFLADRLPFRAGTNFTFRVTTTNAAPFRAQLVWTDYPAEAEAAIALQNDLDLTVRSRTCGTVYGNGGTAPDEINTVESVRLESAPPATYVVTVTCPKICVAYDDPELKGGAAAIYIRGAFDPQDVTCDAPAGTIWTIR